MSLEPTYEQLEKRIQELEQAESQYKQTEQAEKVPRESEERYRRLFNTVTDAILVFDAETKRFIDVNEAALDLYGYTKEEFLGLTLLDITAEPEESRSSIRRTISEEITNIPIRFHRKKNGTVFPVEISVGSFKSGNRQILCGIIRDISERKRTTERIERLNRLNETLLSSGSLNEKLRLITDGVVKIFKADFARIWMIKPGDLCDSECLHAIVREGSSVCRHREECLHLFASSGRYTHIDGGHRRVPLGCYKIGRIAAGGEPKLLSNDVVNDPRVHDHEWALKIGLVSFAGYRLLSASGRVHGVLALFSKQAISCGEDAQLESLAGTTAQVIQTSQAVQALNESEEKFSTMLETIPDPVVLYDTQGFPKYLNPSFIQTFGWSLDELRDQRIPFVPDDQQDLIRTKIKELYEQGKPVRIESKRLTKKGALMNVYISAALVKDSGGNPKGMVVNLTDITGRKNLEEEREKIIHQLKNALKKVRQLSGLLPICSHCKKIRDDEGYWTEIESYIDKRSEAEFSHGICKECAEKYYPELDIYDD